MPDLFDASPLHHDAGPLHRDAVQQRQRMFSSDAGDGRPSPTSTASAAASSRVKKRLINAPNVDLDFSQDDSLFERIPDVRRLV